MIRLVDFVRSISFVLDHLLDPSPLGGLLLRPSVISDPVPCSRQREQSPFLAFIDSLLIALLGAKEHIQCPLTAN